MKNLICTILLFSLSMMAEASWRPSLNCDDGDAVIDLNTDLKQDAQIVIRDQEVLSHFQRKGMANLKWGQTELVIKGRRGYINHGSSNIDIIPRDFSNPASFDTFVTSGSGLGNGYEGKFFHVHRQDGGVAVKLFFVKAPYSRYVDENQGYYVNMPGYTSFIGEYTFHNCRNL